MIYTTHNGVRLEITSIPRKDIDNFFQSHPYPEPPKREAIVIGGLKELVDDYDSPEYNKAVFAYNLKVAKEQMSLLVDGIKILDNWQEMPGFLELVQAGIAKHKRQDFLTFYALNDNDISNVIDEIMYLSTVTERGIQEASKMFNVKWYSDDVMAWGVRNTPASFSSLFEQREAANYEHISWQEFTTLSGKEQSAIVAHRRLKMRLESLLANERK